MIGTQRRRFSRTAALAAGIFSVAGTGLMNLACAQATGSANNSAPIKLTPPAGFVAAPSLPLGYIPAAMAGGDLTSSGHTDMVAADFASGEVVVYLSDGHGGFATPVRYAAVPSPDAVVIADLNGDGKADVVVASSTSGTIVVLPGVGNGTLGTARPFALGFNAGYLAVGDFTGNGHVDVAAAGLTTRAVAVLENDGAGNLAKPVLFATAQVPTGLVVGDFNRDGRADIAVAQSDGNIGIFSGEGNAQFRASSLIPAVKGPISSIATGDFNRDGNADLAVTAANGNAVSILLGKGDGTFAAPIAYGVGAAPMRVTAADTDGDGIPDLIVANRDSNTFSVLRGKGDGTFEPAQNFVPGSGPEELVAGEFYGSGHADLAVMNTSAQTMSVPAGNGNGTFQAARSYTVGEQPVAVAAADLNGDGRPDLVVANYCGTDASCSTNGNAVVLVGGADGTYQIGSSYPLGAGPVATALIDVNGDKHPDLVAVNRLDRTLMVRLGVGDGTFGQPITVPLAGAPKAVAAGNFHGSRTTDLAVLEDCGSASCTQPGSVEILSGAGDGNFQSTGLYPAGYAPVGLAVGSLDGSGHTDIVVANRCGTSADCSAGGTATVLLGDGTGNFKAEKNIALGNDPEAIALGDLTGSGVLDAVVSRGSDNSVAIFRGNGDGTFQSGIAYQAGQGPGALAIADFNGDGKPDIVVANTGDATASVLFGNGDGTLQPAFSLSLSGHPAAIAALSVPKTGPTGLVTANGSTAASTSASSDVTVVLNLNATPALTGGPAPTTTITWTTGSSSPSSVNQTVSFTATVTGKTGDGAPTGGNVEFFSDGTAISDCGGASGITVTAGAGVVSTAVCPTSVLTASSSGHAITAKYLGAGDAVYDSSAVSAAITQVVGPLTPTIDLTTTPPSPASPQPLNTSVTFTATLSGVTFTPITPTGTVAFQADGTTIAGCSAQSLSTTDAGVTYHAACTTASLALTPSPHSIVAIFNGSNADTNYKKATSSSISYTITPPTPKIDLTTTPPSPASPQPLNTSVTFTATLSGVTFTPTAPTGTVAFQADSSTISTCSAQSLSTTDGGVTYHATCTTASLQATPSPHVIVAIFNGSGADTNYSKATSPSISYSITALTPTLSLTPTPGSSEPVNTSVTFTAQLSGTFPATVAPSGKVTFQINSKTSTDCPSATVNANGLATCTTASLVGPSDQIQATYSGDSNYIVSGSTTVTETITRATPVVTITQPATTPVVNQQVVLTAQVAATSAGTASPVAPTSNVTFSPAGNTCTAPVGLTGNPGEAPCTYAFTATSSGVSITASYIGDNDYEPGSATVSQVVNPATTTVQAPPSNNSPGVNVPLSFQATVTPQYSGATIPTGTVTITDTTAGTQICKQTLSSTGTVPPCPWTFTTSGSHSIQASYTSGDANFISNSQTSPLTVGATNTVVQLTPSISSPAVNEPLSFQATVVPQSSGTALPTGTVTITDTTTSTQICKQTLSAGAVSACPYTFTTSGSHSIQAVYTSGDSNFNSNSQTVAPTVVAATTTVQLNPSTNSPAVDAPMSFLVNVIPQYTGATLPTGTVTVTDTTTSTQICKPTLSGGTVPACPYTFTTSGAHSIQAVFTTGDTNFTSSPTATDVVTVGSGGTAVTLSSSTGNWVVNQPVTFTVAINTGGSGSSSGLDGKIVYSDTTTSTTLCSVTVASGTVPSCTPTAFATAGIHSVQAAFTSTNSNFNSGSSNLLTQNVSKAQTTTTLQNPSPSPSQVNQAVVYTVAVATTPSTPATPTGSVTVNAVLGSVTTPECTVTLPNTTCTGVLAQAGTYTITASYSGDTNFVTSASTGVTQKVGAPQIAIKIVPPGSAVVNGPVTFSATVTPSIIGATAPSGNLIFSDSVANTQLCSSAPLVPGASGSSSAGTSSASCSVTFLAAGNHTITATYAGDTNFPGGTQTSAVTVQKASTALALTPAQVTAVAAGAPVTFSVVVTPTPLGAALPTGSITFSSTNAYAEATLQTCGTGAVVTVTDNPKGTAVASCTVTFPHVASPPGTFNVAAVYSGDSNFAADSNTANTTSSVTVQDVNISLNLTPTGNAGDASLAATSTTPAVDYVTQGFNNTTDLFNAASITTTVATAGEFSGALTFTCSVVNPAMKVQVTDPSCAVAPTSESGSGGVYKSVAVTLTASATAQVGEYSVTVQAAGTNFPTLTSQTINLFVLQVNGTLNLASGASGSAQAVFNTASASAGASLASFSCPSVLTPSGGAASFLTTCTGQSTTVTGDSTTVPISISFSAKTTSTLAHPSMTVYAATFATPFFALIVWLGTKKSSRRNFFRFLGMVLVVVGFASLNGCGGSFTGPNIPVNKTITPGAYYIEVQATDGQNKTYYTIIPILITQE